MKKEGWKEEQRSFEKREVNDVWCVSLCSTRHEGQALPLTQPVPTDWPISTTGSSVTVEFPLDEYVWSMGLGF